MGVQAHLSVLCSDLLNLIMGMYEIQGDLNGRFRGFVSN